MGRNRHYGKILERINITDAGAEGVSIARFEQKVIFVKGGVPGDIADLRIVGKKKKFLIAEIQRLHHSSEKRSEPFCAHFGTCGGCKWQHMNYSWQAYFKQKQVKDSMERIGGFSEFITSEILVPKHDTHYRNKMDYAFSNARWLSREDIHRSEAYGDRNALGFHVPGKFDKVLHVETCHLMHGLHNDIRNWMFDYAQNQELDFFNIKQNTGLLRNLMIRNTKAGQWMLIMLYFEPEHERIKKMLLDCSAQFPQISSVYMGHNDKANDSIYDVELRHIYGLPYLEEELMGLTFRVQPKSFFQTNPFQAESLYQAAIALASLKSDDLVYDLYCGTGTISLCLARTGREVVGIESAPQAIADAQINARINAISNCRFVVGDMRDVFTSEFMKIHGKPDVVVTDPPRAGMHPKVVEQLKHSGARRIVYVSCNPATQARDMAMLADVYQLESIQPVDMFPHTHHVENIALLIKKEP